VAQGACLTRLALEAQHSFGVVSVVRQQNLECNRPFHRRVDGAENFGVAAGAYGLFDPIFAKLLACHKATGATTLFWRLRS